MARVECNFCVNYIPPTVKDDNLFGKVITNAQCKLGKKVMFRKDPERTKYTNRGGFIRECNEFNDTEDIVKKIEPNGWDYFGGAM